MVWTVGIGAEIEMGEAGGGKKRKNEEVFQLNWLQKYDLNAFTACKTGSRISEVRWSNEWGTCLESLIVQLCSGSPIVCPIASVFSGLLCRWGTDALEVFIRSCHSACFCLFFSCWLFRPGLLFCFSCLRCV